MVLWSRTYAPTCVFGLFGRAGSQNQFNILSGLIWGDNRPFKSIFATSGIIWRLWQSIASISALNRGEQMSRTLPEITGILAFDHEGIVALVEELGLPKFRVAQLETWLYSKYAASYDDMTDLPKALREQLSSQYPLNRARVVHVSKSKDRTRKYVVQLGDGTLVETVGIPSKDRLTVCVSTQAGCTMGCAFCATGKGGFSRSLAPGEIVEQAILVSNDFSRRATNIVMMGQGEPFLNYDASIGAARFLNSKNGLDIGARHITISTCGIVPQIRKFSSIKEQFTLAVSLHSAVQRTRDKIMPGVKAYTLDRLRSCLISYFETTGRRPTLEYALMQKVNDSEEELDALIVFCKKLSCHVNLIPVNKVEGSRFKPSVPERLQMFSDALNKKGIETSIRRSRGSDINGACGQLIQNYLDNSNEEQE